MPRPSVARYPVGPGYFAGQVPVVSRTEVTSSSRSFRSSLATSTPRGGAPAVGSPVGAAPAVSAGFSIPVISTRLPVNCAALPSFAPVSS
jgi:hypothetical protein